MALRVPSSRRIPVWHGIPHHDDPQRPGRSLHLSLYRKIATVFVLLAVGLFGFVLYLSFARALVTIVPKTEPVSTELSVAVAEAPKVGVQSVPGYVLETVVDGTKTVTAEPSGGEKPVEGLACGTVTIVNGQAKDQPLVATTRLLTPQGVLFRIKRSVTVPAGGKIDVEACADKPGAAGDVGPTKFTIPGLNATLQQKTYAESSKPMTGGSSVSAVTSEVDLKKAEESLTAELTAKAMAKLKALVPSELGEGAFSTANVVMRETNAVPGAKQSSFTVSLSLHVVGVFYDPIALGQSAGAALRTSVGAGKDLVSVDQGSVSAVLDAADPAAKSASLRVKVSGAAVLRQGPDAFDKSRIAGLTPKDAEQYLRSLPSVSSAKVRLRPAWARTVPTLQDHIDITVLKPQ